MEYTLEEIKEEFEKQKAELSNIENEIKELYEDRAMINEIRILEEISGPINQQIIKCKQNIEDLKSYELAEFSSDIQYLLNKLDRLNKYKDFIDKKGNSDLKGSTTLNEIEKDNLKQIETKKSEKELKVDLIENLRNICDDILQDISIEKGQGGNIESQLNRYRELTDTINHFERYGKFLTKESKEIMARAKQTQKELEEEIVKKLPDLGKVMERALSKEDILKDKYEDIKKEILESDKKQNEVESIKEEIQKELQRITEFTYGEIEEKLNDQTKKIQELEARKQLKEADTKNINEIIDELMITLDDKSNKQKEEKKKIELKTANETVKENDMVISKKNNVNEIIETNQSNNDKKDDKSETLETMSEILERLNIDGNVNKKITKEQIEEMDRIIEEKTNKKNEESIPQENKEPKKIPKLNKQDTSESLKIQQPQQEQVLTEEDYRKMEYYYGNPEKINKKVKRKTSKQGFEQRIKSALKQIKNFFIQEIPETKQDILENVEDKNEQVSTEILNDYLFTEKYGEAIQTELEEKGRNK